MVSLDSNSLAAITFARREEREEGGRRKGGERREGREGEGREEEWRGGR